MDLGAFFRRADKLRIARIGLVLVVLVATPIVAFVPGTPLLVRVAFCSGVACGFLVGIMVARWTA